MVGWSSVTLIVGVGVGKLIPGVVDVGLIPLSGVVDWGGGFDVTWPGVIVNGWFIPFSSTQKFIVVVVGDNVLVVVGKGPAIPTILPVDESGTVVDGSTVVGRGVVLVVIAVVVTSTHAIKPTVT